MRIICLLIFLCVQLHAADTIKALFAVDDVRVDTCMVIGLGDDQVVGELIAHESIQLLIAVDKNAQAVQKTRSLMAENYGSRSAQLCNFADLPISDSVINCIVIPDYASCVKEGLLIDEALRVLCPHGSLFITGGDQELVGANKIVLQGETWFHYIKPVPGNVDEWTHYRYDASSSSVSKDTVVGPVTGIKWIQGKTWSAGFGGAYSILSAHGRNFYVRNGEAVRQEKGTQLEVRDAYNGLPLWNHPAFFKVEKRGWPIAPQVVVGDTYVVVLKTEHGPIQILNPSDGSIRKELVIAAGSTFNVSQGQLFYQDANKEEVAIWDLHSNSNSQTLQTGTVYAGSAMLIDGDHIYFRAGVEGDKI
ncbi:MAG: hypothetical protein HRU15_11100, partial [Planctomycetes bacterium]|nr:hypothetical protein [Planctomycetota bacterium]